MAETDTDTKPESQGDEQAPTPQDRGVEANEAATAVESSAPAEGQAQQSETKIARSMPEPPAGKHWWWGVGRRKRAIARVRIRPGDGTFIVNDKEVAEFFSEERDRADVIEPLNVLGLAKRWDVYCNVKGGGYTGQAGAISLGLARALSDALPDSEHDLRARGLLTRDARMVERKKPGQPGARRRFQFSKR